MVWAKNKDGRQSKAYQVRWKCEGCGKDDLPKSEIEMDHIHAIGLSDTMEEWITNLFCDESGYNILCHGCHGKKTVNDLKLIKEMRDARKLRDSTAEASSSVDD